MSLGIDNVKKVLSFAVALGNEAGKDLEDGKISIAEALGSAVALSGEVVKFMQVDFSQLWPEVSDLSAEEYSEISELVKTKLDIPEDKAEEAIKGFLESSKTVYAAIAALIAVYKAFKKPA